MRLKPFILALFLALLCAPAVRAQLAQTTVTGTIYKLTGDPDPNGQLTVFEARHAGSIIPTGTLKFRTDAGGNLLNTDGTVGMKLPRNSSVLVFSTANGLNVCTSSSNCAASAANGKWLTVPDAPTATLESMVSVAVVPSGGLTVKDEGTALATLIGTFNFTGPGVTATQTSPGIATVDITGSVAPVTSVFGRTGAVVAAANDYTFAQLASTPTTLAGYGITDGVPSSRTVNGHALSGNVTVTPTDLSLVIGTNTQAWDADLDAIAALNTTGFAKRTGANTWTLDSSIYLTGNQTITLSGDISGSGATAITTSLGNIPSATPMAGSLLGTNITAPGTPASGKTSLYIDSTDKRFHDKNDAGTVGTTVVADTGAANNFITAVSAAGVISKAQPTFANLASTPTTLGGYGITNGADTALDNLASVNINSALLAQTGIDLGSTTKPFRELYLFGSGTYGTTSIKLTGTPTGARVVTLPDSSTTIPIASQLLTFTGPSAGRTITLPDASISVARTDAGQTFTGVNTFSSVPTASGLNSAAGVALALVTTAAAQTASTTAGLGLNITADAAVAGSTNAGAAAGGSVTITAGAAARLTSGNAAGGNIALTPGAGIGTGAPGKVLVSDGFIVGWSNAQNPGFSYNSATDASAIIVNMNNVSRFAFKGDILGLISTGKFAWSSSTTTPNLSYDAALARNGIGVVEVDNGTAGQWGSLLVGVRDAGTTTVTNGLTVGHQSTGTPAALFGSGIQFNANDSTTADVGAGQFYSAWETATHASRRSFVGIQTVGHSQTQLDREVLGPTLQPTNNTVTTTTSFTLASNTVIGAVIRYAVEVFDGTNLQVETGEVSCNVINKGGVFTQGGTNGCTKYGNVNNVSSGTLAVTWTLTGANPSLLQVNANSSLTPSAGYPRVTYSISNLTTQALSVQ